MTTTEAVAVAGFLLNAAAVVWGAAKLSAAVDHLKETVLEIKTVVMNVQTVVHGIIARVAVLEFQVQDDEHGTQ